jgi:hypothetical protein
MGLIEFVIDKTKLLDRLRGQLNGRQQKTLPRMSGKGLKGVQCGGTAPLLEYRRQRPATYRKRGASSGRGAQARALQTQCALVAAGLIFF